MRQRTRKGVSIALVLMLLMAFLSGAAVTAVEPVPGTGLTLTADKTLAYPGDTINFTVGLNLLAGAISGYSATQVALFLPVGLEYQSSVVYIDGSPMVAPSSPATTPAGTSVVLSFNNNVTYGAAQIRIATKVGANASGSLTSRAEVYLQPTGGQMPATPNEQRTLAVQIQGVVQPPTLQVSRVTFNLTGGTRIGGGALVQAVPYGGAAVEPYVFRKGYIFTGWDSSFTNVRQDITVSALWVPSNDAGTIPVVPPIYDFVTGHFVNDRNTFTQHSHMPLIYYADRHVMYLVSVAIDGRVLTTGSQYVATTGLDINSTAIHLKASYLNTLPVGYHTLRVTFANNLYVEAQFTVTRYVNTFNDVNSGDWFYKGVEAMTASDLLRGVSATQFDPFSYMTRGMVVTLLYRFAGEPSITGFVNPFPDVAAGQYYTNAVIWAAANGIVVGHENGMFAPNNIMTREQFAAVLYRYQDALGSVTMDILMDYQFSDFNQISTFARSPVTKLTMQGVFYDWPADQAGRFQPRASVSRAEVATAMRLWIESIGW